MFSRTALSLRCVCVRAGRRRAFDACFFAVLHGSGGAVDENVGLSCLFLNVEVPAGASRVQEDPAGLTRTQGIKSGQRSPGGVRRNQGGAKRSDEEPRGARGSQEERVRRTRKSQEEPGRPTRTHDDLGGEHLGLLRGALFPSPAMGSEAGLKIR